MSYKDQEMNAKTKQFGISCSDDFDWSESIMIEFLKEYAERYGCDPESMHNFTREEGNGHVAAYARFNEKEHA